jgi:hypothetical protein
MLKIGLISITESDRFSVAPSTINGNLERPMPCLMTDESNHKVWSYGQITFPANFTGQGFLIRILPFGWMELYQQKKL